MKIYILTDDPWHENETYFGAYTTQEKAFEAIKNFIPDKTYCSYKPKRVLEIEVDLAGKLQAEKIILELE